MKNVQCVSDEMLSLHDRNEIERVKDLYYKSTGNDLMVELQNLEKSILSVEGKTSGGDGSSVESKKAKAIACWIISLGVSYFVLGYILGPNTMAGILQESQRPCLTTFEYLRDMVPPLPGHVSCLQRAENFRNLVLTLLTGLAALFGTVGDFNPLDPRWWFRFFGVSGGKGGNRRHTRRRAHKRSSHM